MSAICEGCKKDFTDDPDKIQCTGKCKLFFHYSCVALSTTNLRREKKTVWICPACKKTSSTSSESKTNNSDVIKLIEELRRENENYKQEVLKKLELFEQSLQFTSDLVEKSNETNKNVQEELKQIKELNKKLLEENSSLQLKVSKLENDIIDLQQYSRRQNVEISNLPEVPNEKMDEVKMNIMNALGVDLSKNLTIVHRVPTTKKEKIKPIIMQFDSVASKSEFMKAAKLKKITADAVNSCFEKLPVYINDHLCPDLKKLLYDCKVFKRQNDFKYCWSKNGKIFLRKTEGSKIYRIKCNSDLNNVSS